ncbi:hypothetical protein [Komagataeibacter diospyri]|uniref:hypothetical protein n=1 Tax=Komagataeibacter diospyri TaxID=1932662 RepID=UPI0037569306
MELILCLMFIAILASPFISKEIFKSLLKRGENDRNEKLRGLIQEQVFTSVEDYKRPIQEELTRIVSSLKREENQEFAKLTGEVTRVTEEFKTITGRSLDRKIRFNQKEYEGLAECWLDLRNAFEDINKILLEPLVLQPIDDLDEAKLNSYLDFLKLNEDQKNIVKNSKNKALSLFNIQTESNIEIIRVRSEKLINSIYKYQIFFDEEIYEKFHRLFTISENIWFCKKRIANPFISEETKNIDKNYILENSGIKIQKEMSILLVDIKNILMR